MSLDAIDELDRAAAFIELVMMSCRECDEDLNAIAVGLCAAGEHLERAKILIGTPTVGGPDSRPPLPRFQL